MKDTKYDNKESVNVLIVDDKPANLDALEAILHSTGYNIVRANSGSEALKLLLQAEYACCLLDIRMPDMDGFETARLIRNDIKFSNLPIIFVTAEAGAQHDVFMGYDVGAVDFLIKPLEPLIVRSKVQVFGQLYLQKRQLEHAKVVEKLNQELQQLNKSLYEANQDLEHFTHITAHDLREPLRKQRNIIDLIRNNINDFPKDASDLLGYVADSSDQMLGMINDFRALTKIGFGQEFNREKVDIRDVIEQCLGNHEDLISQFRPEIRFDLKSTTANMYVPLAKILYNNIIKNIFDHVCNEKFEILFTSEEYNNSYLYGVKNTGSSVPQERLRDIFKMFRKLGSSSHERSGIGLSICKRVVDRHHGAIFAESGSNSFCVKFTFGETL